MSELKLTFIKIGNTKLIKLTILQNKELNKFYSNSLSQYTIISTTKLL